MSENSIVIFSSFRDWSRVSACRRQPKGSLYLVNVQSNNAKKAYVKPWSDQTSVLLDVPGLTRISIVPTRLEEAFFKWS